jgi:hypothetical protein
MAPLELIRRVSFRHALAGAVTATFLYDLVRRAIA